MITGETVEDTGADVDTDGAEGKDDEEDKAAAT